MKPLILTSLLCAAITATAAAKRHVGLPPRSQDAPRINGPTVYGVHAWAPFLYHIPASGARPMEFSATGLPDWLKLNPRTGDITGDIEKKGEHIVMLHVKNAIGTAKRKLRIVIGTDIGLTPPMGWTSTRCYGTNINAEKILAAARAIIDSGLAEHGWSYVNIGDGWQGIRNEHSLAIQPNAGFPDMKALCDEIHGMGLKVGIYSTPWKTSYGGFIGGSADNEEGTWAPPESKKPLHEESPPWAIEKYSFAYHDAQQWAAWGIDYLRYEWMPNEIPETQEMSDALRQTARDIFFSLGKKAPFDKAAMLSTFANSWQTAGKIKDTWEAVRGRGFSLDKWAHLEKAGHWNDPDTLLVGRIGTGNDHETRLTPDEQYTQMSLWCLLSAPLMISCDLEQMDSFTQNLLSNDEVIALDQDALARPASCVLADGPLFIYAKELETGSKAVGLFNLSDKEISGTVGWADLKIRGKMMVRDLWRRQDVGVYDGAFTTMIRPHGVMLIRVDNRKK